MPEPTLNARVRILEQEVEDFKVLPARMQAVEGRLHAVEVQIVQLRQEMRAEFSTVRLEIQVGDGETRRYMRVLHEEVISRIARLGESQR